jgi:hypothetical protein
MTTKRLLIIGASGHGRAVAEAASMDGRLVTTAFLDDAPNPPSHVWDVPMWGSSAGLASCAGCIDIVIVDCAAVVDHDCVMEAFGHLGGERLHGGWHGIGQECLNAGVIVTGLRCPGTGRAGDAPWQNPVLMTLPRTEFHQCLEP